MGSIYSRLKLLLEAKKVGVDFSSTLIIGRQKLSLSKKENKKLVLRYNIDTEVDDFNYGTRDYADKILSKYLNITELVSLDYSNYEGATINVDLNKPISNSLHNKFDVLIDGGTIEHIFNFPVAIENYMNMVKKNGSIFIFTNANNHFGHGFYQYSPELFFRVFNEKNGFELKSVIIVKHPFPGAELSEKQICYKVADPKEIGRRSTIVSKSPLGIMVHAIKRKNTSIFEEMPIQSDYSKLWGNNQNAKNNNIKKTIRFLINLLPRKIKNNILGMRQIHKFSIKNDKEYFTKWE